MESFSARQPAQRRSSPVPSQRQSTSSARLQTEDSQTIFVQKDEENETEEHESQEPQQQDASSQTSPSESEQHILPHQLPQPDEDVPKCWICLLDASEDDSNSSPWRSPCPCALVAHEACLLDWIADVEAPSKHPTSKPKVSCPQCKSEIRLSRPRDLIVDAFQAVERLGAYAFPRAAVLALCGVLYGACAAGGVHTIYAVFGAEEGGRILEPVLQNMVRAPVDAFVGTPQEAGREVLDVVMDHVVHWRLYVGLPLITPTLVLSRTSLADGILPILPVLFFVTKHHRGMVEGDIMQWPPSAEFAFAVLPYVRGLYNAYYKWAWAERKKKWLAELQPRTGSNPEGDAAAADGLPANNAQLDAIPADDDDENVVEIRVDGGIFDDWDAEPEEEDELPELQPVEQQQQPAPQLEPAPPPPQIQDNRPPPPNALPPGQREVLSFSPTGIATTVLGALLFPTVSSLAGEALKLVLPTSWLVGKGSQRTFLQAKWARTLVGGCLLVLGKDALVLYVRWKMARMQRGRRVVDYDRSQSARA